MRRVRVGGNNAGGGGLRIVENGRRGSCRGRNASDIAIAIAHHVNLNNTHIISIYEVARCWIAAQMRLKCGSENVASQCISRSRTSHPPTSQHRLSLPPIADMRFKTSVRNISTFTSKHYPPNPLIGHLSTLNHQDSLSPSVQSEGRPGCGCRKTKSDS